MYSKYKSQFPCRNCPESDISAVSDDLPVSDVDSTYSLEEETEQDSCNMDFCDYCGDIIEDSGHNCLCEETEDNAHSDVVEVENNKKELDIDIELKEQWEKEQQELRKQTIPRDCDDWSIHHITSENQGDFPGKTPLKYVAGVDISFIKEDNVNACAALVVLNFPELEVVYKDLSMVELTAPYIPGFLAFREASFLVEKIEKLQKYNPEICPQVIMVDGNGILHPRRCGLAVHLGIAVNLPTLGVAKNLFAVDGLTKDSKHKAKIKKLKKGGESFPLITDGGETIGMALRSHDESTNPVFVSAGHKLSLDTAMWLTQLCCKKRVPEPTRWADLKSREFIREKYFTKPPKQKHVKTKKPKRSTEQIEKKGDVTEEVDLSDLFIS